MENNVFQDMKTNDGIWDADPVSRMMKRYELEKGDYENTPWAQAFFDKLQWSSKTKDIIMPFWRIFCSSMVFCSEKNELRRGNWKTESVRPTYVFDENSMLYRTEYNKKSDEPGLPISKKKIGSKYHEKNTVHYEYVRKTVSLFGGLAELAEITDSMANFAPCPEYPFNTLKGIMPDVCDFLNLMIDKIQLCTDANRGIKYKEYAADADQVKRWHQWFIDNREKYFLNEYYYINGNNLTGRPVFKTQSLQNPLPKTEEEIQECIDSVIRIIRGRGNLINAICCVEKP